MRLLARPFLESEDSNWGPIEQWLSDLRSLRDSRSTQAFGWSIDERNPIRTEISENGYERADRKCKFKDVRGELSCVWEIRKENPRDRGFFILAGQASTKLKVLDVSQNGGRGLLAQWQFEVGNHQSPGCHFHVGILQCDASRPFPEGLSVPRLPGILVTPMDSLEYLLGEIFQDKWEQRASEHRNDVLDWAGCQRRRLGGLLQWYGERIKNAGGSPWTFLKRCRPEIGIFTDDGKR